MNPRLDQDLAELDWLAFCYIADELDESQRASFERQLAEQQSARDAVERAMRLCQLVYAVPQEQSTPPSTHGSVVSQPASLLDSRQERSAWQVPGLFASQVVMAATVVMALATVLWFWNIRQHPQPMQVATNSTPTQLELLADSWLDVLESADESNGIGESEEYDNPPEIIDQEMAGWMYEALNDLRTTNMPEGKGSLNQ